MFHYTGDSHLVRLVPSKPDRVGLWFYQLAGKFSNNLPYLLNTFVHDNSEGAVKVVEVVQRWINVFATVPNSDKCYLAFDSYYRNIRFTASAQGDRFSALVRTVRPPGKSPELREWKGIYNTTTGETFVYHYDTQKGVGVKYNYARGFLRSQNRTHIKEHKDRFQCTTITRPFLTPVTTSTGPSMTAPGPTNAAAVSLTGTSP